MRILGTVFFVLLALQLVIRHLSPRPAPTWSRIAVVACCVGVILCLLIKTVVERAQRGEDDRKPDSPAE